MKFLYFFFYSHLNSASEFSIFVPILFFMPYMFPSFFFLFSDAIPEEIAQTLRVPYVTTVRLKRPIGKTTHNFLLRCHSHFFLTVILPIPSYTLILCAPNPGLLHLLSP